MYSREVPQKKFVLIVSLLAFQSSLLALMAVCILKQIVIADALLEIDKVRKLCVEKSTPDRKWQNLLQFTSRYLRDIVSALFTKLISLSA